MRKCCSTTIFLSIIFVLVSALIFGLLESARTAGVRFYLQTAADSSIDSLFSEYHRDVWEDYRLILLECRKEQKAVKSLEAYLKTYVENSGIYRLKEPSVNISDIQYITDNGGKWFENEVLDYMKYNLIDFEHTPETTQQLAKDIEEAGTMKEITTAYGEHSKEAAGLEKSLSKISSNFNTQKELYNQALEDIKNKNRAGFEDKVVRIKAEIGKLDNFLSDYQRKADKLSENLSETEAKDGTDDILSRIEDREDEEDYDEDEADELWDELKSQWETFNIPVIESRHGIADEKKEELIENAGKKFGGEILELVIPPDRTLSHTSIDTIAFPSKTSVSERLGENTGLIDAVIMDEYAVRFFTDFTDKSEKEVQYELEYIIAGLDNDTSNLRSVLLKILAIREGLNYIHIVTDKNKMDQVNTLANIISGVFGVPALSVLISCLIIGVWALAESIIDIRALLAGKKVPIYKTASDWKLSLDSLLASGGSGGSSEPPLLKKPEKGEEAEDESDGKGIDYEAYLRLMLLVEDGVVQDYRMMDMIQHNIGYKKKDFLMNKMIYGMNISVQCTSERAFCRFGLVRDELASMESSYKLGVNTLKVY